MPNTNYIDEVIKVLRELYQIQGMHYNTMDFLPLDETINKVRQALEKQSAYYENELKIADERWKSNEHYREKYMDREVEHELEFENQQADFVKAVGEIRDYESKVNPGSKTWSALNTLILKYKK